MQVVGMNGGRATVFTEAQLADFIDAKSGRVMRRNGVTGCAAYMMSHNGVNTGGGCPGHVQFSGRTVFHDSHGQRGSNDGCTVFFAPASALVAPDTFATAVLLAVGRHDQDVGGQPHYQLDWSRPGWFAGNSIQF